MLARTYSLVQDGPKLFKLRSSIYGVVLSIFSVEGGDLFVVNGFNRMEALGVKSPDIFDCRHDKTKRIGGVASSTSRPRKTATIIASSSSASSI